MSATAVGWMVAIGVAVAVGGPLLYRRWRASTLVERHSEALRRLGELNAALASRLAAPPKLVRHFEDALRSKQAFDRHDLRAFLFRCLASHRVEINGRLAERTRLETAFTDYLREVQSIASTSLGGSTAPDLPAEKFRRIEQRLFDRRKLDRPNVVIDIRCTVTYRSPKGRNFYKRSAAFGLAEIAQAMVELEHVDLTRLQAQQQREQLSASTRVDVLNRDGRRCRMCGRTSAVVELHVDHIVPVSRGGTNDMSNLQALCRDCNLGKSNRFVG